MLAVNVIDEASDFKFGKQLEFSKAHHQIPPEENVGGYGPELGELPKFGVAR